MHCHIGRIGACHLPQFPQWKNTHQQLDIGYGIVRVNVIQHKLCTCKSIKSLHYIWYSAHILVTSAFHSSPKHWGHVIPTWLYTDGQFCVSEHQTVCLPPKWTMLKTKSVKVATINIIHRDRPQGGKEWLVDHYVGTEAMLFLHDCILMVKSILCVRPDSLHILHPICSLPKWNSA